MQSYTMITVFMCYRRAYNCRQYYLSLVGLISAVQPWARCLENYEKTGTARD